MIRLTFDDGPSQWTEPILDLLAEHGQTATFFVVGESIAGRGRILQRMLEEGHTIGNHTFTHARLTDLENAQVSAEFRACSAVITLACGAVPTVWRAPMFARDERIDRVAKSCKLTEHMGRDVEPHDWNIADAELIAAKVLALAEPGAVVCLHDGIPPDGGNGTSSRQPTVDAVRLILEARP
jgi:peptidoglycan/xylan/chitin deacetylase (PgdA/CDA1 family)